MSSAVFFVCMNLLVACSTESASETGDLNGIVSDRATGEPISGVDLTLSPSGLSKISGSDGRYEFQGIEARQYNIQASASQYSVNTKLVTVKNGAVVKCDIPLSRSGN